MPSLSGFIIATIARHARTALAPVLLASLGLACGGADAALLIYHHQLAAEPLPPTQRTSAICRIKGATLYGDNVFMYEGMVQRNHSPEISFDHWPAPSSSQSPEFAGMSLNCRIWGPHFTPSRAYHLALDWNHPFWRVAHLHALPVYPAQDKRVVLVIEDRATADATAPDGVHRRVRLRGAVSQDNGNGDRFFLGAYETWTMDDGPL